ncbi:IS66 family insertion sequence element accessory protein TnpB [Ensifer sp.]|uniref:IS66 family insertion sequence element accessory protein TnpB n=1 Tax=Ensifer sp. TaxID=1872086 RepID=UPI0039C88613
MIGPTGNVRIYLACGMTDMRRGIDGLSAMIKAVIKEAPGCGSIFGFRGKHPDQACLMELCVAGQSIFAGIHCSTYFLSVRSISNPTAIVLAPHMNRYVLSRNGAEYPW